MDEQTPQLPKGAEYTMVIWLDRKQKKQATFHLKEMDENLYMAAQTYIDNGKDLDATRLIIKGLHVGGDDPKLLDGNLVGTLNARKQVRELMLPMDGELKKN
jgi:hypothetical protein